MRTTPNTILGLAGIDVATHSLVRITGRHQHSFASHGEEGVAGHGHQEESLNAPTFDHGGVVSGAWYIWPEQ
ncbi:hypothetical protein ACPCSK_34550 [Streptomyces griseoincarnatus]